MSQDWCEMLCDRVDQAPGLDSLARIMQHIGIDITEIKNMLKQKIKELDDASAKRAVFNVFPIQSIIPIDAIQHILSYQHFSTVREVNKTFKKCFDHNQDIAKRLRPGIVQDHSHYFSPDIHYDESVNKTYLINCNGEKSKKENIIDIDSYGTIIPFKGTLDECMSNEFKSGDRILLLNGDYGIIGLDTGTEEDVIAEIIGIGESVNMRLVDCDFTVFGKSKVMLKNINIIVEEQHLCICVEEEATLWMDNCEVKADQGVVVAERGAAHFKSCTFIGKEIALSFEGDREFRDEYANVLGCTFKGYMSCIETDIPIRCIGNLFINNDGTVQSGRDRLKRLELINKSIFKGNVFEGPNIEFEWLYYAKTRK